MWKQINRIICFDRCRWSSTVHKSANIESRAHLVLLINTIELKCYNHISKFFILYITPILLMDATYLKKNLWIWRIINIANRCILGISCAVKDSKMCKQQVHWQEKMLVERDGFAVAMESILVSNSKRKECKKAQLISS